MKRAKVESALGRMDGVKGSSVATMEVVGAGDGAWMG